MPLAVTKHFVLIGKGGEVIKSLEGETNTAICFTQVPRFLLLRLRLSAYVSIRQHTSAYVSIRQHT